MGAANENQWREFWQRLDARSDALPLWQQLLAAYTESWRAYHNLDHIGHCLAEFASVRNLAEDSIAVEAAIWFHDAVYDTHKKDNEERSADLADGVLQVAGKSVAFCESVRTLILATKHQAQPLSNDARLLTDIDLSILGQSPERYAEFELQVRREYAWVADADFAAGRSAILAGFLSRPGIFHCPLLVEKYETRARQNLKLAIAQLDSNLRQDCDWRGSGKLQTWDYIRIVATATHRSA